MAEAEVDVIRGIAIAIEVDLDVIRCALDPMCGDCGIDAAGVGRATNVPAAAFGG